MAFKLKFSALKLMLCMVAHSVFAGLKKVKMLHLSFFINVGI